jgi:hypothetical protein
MHSAPRPRFDRRPIPGTALFDRSNPFIYVGNANGMRKHRARPGSLVAPIDADPELFKWPVQGLSVLVVADEELKVFAARLAGVLVRDGADLVACVSETGPLSYHRR